MTHKWTQPQLDWLAALRSGEYEQGNEFLKNGDKYCCLGVACDVIGMDYDDFEHDVELRDSARDAIGLKCSQGTFSWGKKVPLGSASEPVQCLADANDNGATFSEIADFIEANPEAVFVQGGES